MAIDIHKGLRDLARIVDRLAADAEWKRLAQRERRTPFSTSFDLADRLPENLDDLKVSFITLDAELRRALGSFILADDEDHIRWRRELDAIERNARAFWSIEKYLKD